jgi:hypothetical protein
MCLNLRLTAVHALVIALEDRETSAFLRTAFSAPEQRANVVTERRYSNGTGRRLWHISIIETPRPSAVLTRPLLNIAHVAVDARSGQVRGRWFWRGVFYEEYREFVRKLPSLRLGCKGHIR